jgi:hypothetical protein
MDAVGDGRSAQYGALRSRGNPQLSDLHPRPDATLQSAVTIRLRIRFYNCAAFDP